MGNKIRQLRRKKEMSQEKFALQIGMDRTYFASVETGKRNISIMNIDKIANGLHVSLAELFDGLDEESENIITTNEKMLDNEFTKLES